eukprot:2177751-Amphidinium_carterae.1
MVCKDCCHRQSATPSSTRTFPIGFQARPSTKEDTPLWKGACWASYNFEWHFAHTDIPAGREGL